MKNKSNLRRARNLTLVSIGAVDTTLKDLKDMAPPILGAVPTYKRLMAVKDELQTILKILDGQDD